MRRRIIERLFLDLGRHFHRLPAAEDFQLDFLIQLHLRNNVRSRRKFPTSCPSNLRMTSPLCSCASAAGEPGTTSSTTTPSVVDRADLIRQIDAVLNPEIAANDPPLLQQALERRANRVGRNGEPDALRAAASRNNRGINADDFAPQIDSGPPLLPGLIAALVCRKSPKPSTRFGRPFELMIPSVTVSSNPNGFPMARTKSPACTVIGIAELERLHAGIVHLQNRQINLRIRPTSRAFSSGRRSTALQFRPPDRQRDYS